MKEACRLCGGYCFNKMPHAKYCKECMKIVEWFYARNNSTKILSKLHFPNKIIIFRLIIDKIEDKHGS